MGPSAPRSTSLTPLQEAARASRAGPGREKKPFKRYPLGCLHIDISETRTAEGKACLFVAIDRTSKFVHAGLYTQATRKTAVDFLHSTLKALPYRVHTVLTDNGIPFAKKAGTGMYRAHPFDASASGTASNIA